MKKIIKIVTFYDDGTFSESVPAPAPSVPQPQEYTVWPFPLTELPKIVPTPRPPWTPSTPAEWNVCSKCGLKMEGAMGYVCPQPQCPTGLGGAWCSNNKDPYLD